MIPKSRETLRASFNAPKRLSRLEDEAAVDMPLFMTTFRKFLFIEKLIGVVYKSNSCNDLSLVGQK
jgi:hypothetical protein